VDLTSSFKKTELGDLPEDWQIVRLRECATKVTDGEHLTPIRAKAGYFLLSARNILDGKIDISDVDFVELDEFNRIRKRCNPEFGDVLISCSGSIGRVATVPRNFECVMVRSAALVKPKANILSGIYAQYFLQSNPAQSQIASSINQGAQPNLFLNHIESLKLALPPTLAEQEAIANALSDADAYIESLEKLIEKKRQIKKGAMQELLTGKRRLPGFDQSNGKIKRTEIGNLPADWNIETVGNISSCYSGGTPSTSVAEYYNGPIPWINSGDLNQYRIREVKGRISSLGLSCSSAKLVKPGTLLLAMYGATAGVAAITEIEAAINQAVLAIMPHSLDIELLFQLFVFNKEEFIRTYTQGGQPNFSGLIVKSFKISFPNNPAEQGAISKVLKEMDVEISTFELKLQKAHLMKQGMMQELLTGRIRLV
jgi:type I restriction enzyme S subunit